MNDPHFLTGPVSQCMEFDCRRRRSVLALTPAVRVNAVPRIFMREMHYIGRYDGEGIEFACPRLIIELPNYSTRTPASLLAALASAEFSGFSDVRFTVELWDQPPSTPAGDFNVMTHAWMFGHLDLEEKLKNNSDVIIGAFEPVGIEATPPAAAADSARHSARAGGGPARAGGGDNKQALPINSINRMRVSLHMKRGSPAFSPNNCKLRLKSEGGSFWLLKGDPATRRAIVSFICLLPTAFNSAFLDTMAQQRQCASSAPDALHGAARVSLHTLLSCLQSQPSISDAAAALGACLVVSDDDSPLCSAAYTSAAAALQLSTVHLGGIDGIDGAIEVQQPALRLDAFTAAVGGSAPAPLQLTPEALHVAIKGECSLLPAAGILVYSPFCAMPHI
jgi:hypothetical protein